MITRKELKYVDLWASKIPMPGYEYSIDVVNQMEECYKLFNENYLNKCYNILFSNAEEIEFTIDKANLAHMLGIDTKNINGQYFDYYRKNVLKTDVERICAYDMLELILEHKEDVVNADNSPNFKAKALNYYKSSIKCEIFKKFKNFEDFNFGAVNVNSPKEVDGVPNEKDLFIKSDEQLAPYFIMGIRRNTDNGTYYVTTLLAPDEPANLFNGREAMIPTQIICNNDSELKKMIASAEDKYRLINLYENLINKYNLPNCMNIYSDYAQVLSEITRVRK